MLGQFFTRKSIKKEGKQLYIVAGIIAIDEKDKPPFENGDMSIFYFDKIKKLANVQKETSGMSIDGVLTSPLWHPIWRYLK